ncbi:hypothetical protein ACT3CD_16145 [Geofilum sp. OHC36d9]|uniref:hypothetical protein n=1 Tax=Geofilum sp. OHC36d9 TaxID=3458413 RepID=UPI004033BEAA
MKTMVTKEMAFFLTLFGACPVNWAFEPASLNTRPAQLEKCEFTSVNDHFESKRNAVFGLAGQTLFIVKFGWRYTQ